MVNVVSTKRGKRGKEGRKKKSKSGKWVCARQERNEKAGKRMVYGSVLLT